MANKKHLGILKKGVYIWNEWRKNHLGEIPDLTGAILNNLNLSDVDFSNAELFSADLSKSDLFSADFKDANLNHTDLSHADLRNARFSNASILGAHLGFANLRNANLRNAELSFASFYYADLRSANLSDAKLFGANFKETNLISTDLSNTDLRQSNLCNANLSRANLQNANLQGALLTHTNLSKADLTDCLIYGISAWDIKLDKAIQKNLRITPKEKPNITVDNLEVAQFIYLLLHNEKIRDIIDTITSKVVLILGRFTPKRKAILEGIKEELRRRNYLPVLFDFKGPRRRDTTETITTLAHIARFVIADITDARSVSQELQAIVPCLPSVPVQPLLESSKDEYGMFEHLKRFPWLLAVHRYRNLNDLISTLKEKVIAPVEAKLLKAKK